MLRPLALALLVSLAAAAQDASRPSPPLRIGATAVPHAELLRAVEPGLASQGIRLDVRLYDEYGYPNIDVARGKLDANFFQTEPYLWRWRAAHGAPLVVVGRVHVEPMGLYSRKLTALAQVRRGAIVAVPEDPANLGRALLLLEKAGLLELDGSRGLDSVIANISSNPHALRFRVLPPARVAAQLGSADLVALNGNFALQSHLLTARALAREGADSPFPNVVVALESAAADPRLVALVAALRGPAARRFLVARYGDAVVPAE